MHSLISDIYSYLKQNYPKRATLYSSSPQKFPHSSMKKKKQNLRKSTLAPKIKQIEQPSPKVEPEKIVEKENANPEIIEKTPAVTEKSKKLAIEKINNPVRAPGTDFRSFYGNFSPSFHIHAKPKDDIVAKRVKAKSSDQKVLSDVVIFTDARMLNFNRLLGNIAHAIEIKFCPCRLLDISPIERTNRWENIFSSHKLHLILIPDLVLFQSPRLIEHYKESGDKKTIGNVKAYLLKDLDEIQKNPDKKKALWDSITQAVKL